VSFLYAADNSGSAFNDSPWCVPFVMESLVRRVKYLFPRHKFCYIILFVGNIISFTICQSSMAHRSDSM
jgi:hypothetical protein